MNNEIITVIGDIHVTNQNHDKVTKLFQVIEKLENTVILLGDVLDTKEVVRSKSLNLVYNLLKSSKLDFHIIVGNHDFHNLEAESGKHSLVTLQDLPNVTVYDKPTKVGTLFFVPYVHGKQAILEAIRVPNAKDLTLIGHLDIVGFDYGNGFISESGADANDFKSFKRVLMGHYHKHCTKGNLTYLGTPFSQSYGETNQDKYIATLNTDTDELKLIPTNSIFPRHLTITVDCNKQTTLDTTKLKEKDYHRVILTGKPENIGVFDKASLKKEAKGVKLIEKPKKLSDKKGESGISEELSNEAQFKSWGKEVKKLDKDTLELGLQILEACK